MNVKADIKQPHKVDMVAASELWSRGISAADIGIRWGVSKNVIIGLAARNRALFPTKPVQGSRFTDPSQKKPLPTRKYNVRTKEEKDRDQIWSRRENAKKARAAHLLKARSGSMRSASEVFKARAFAPPKLDPYDIIRLEFAKPLHELDSGECKWPLNEGKPFLFCAEATLATYCECHQSRAKRVVI